MLSKTQSPISKYCLPDVTDVTVRISAVQGSETQNGKFIQIRKICNASGQFFAEVEEWKRLEKKPGYTLVHLGYLTDELMNMVSIHQHDDGDIHYEIIDPIFKSKIPTPSQ